MRQIRFWFDGQWINERDIHAQVGNGGKKIQWVPAAADRRLSLKTELATLQLVFTDKNTISFRKFSCMPSWLLQYSFLYSFFSSPPIPVLYLKELVSQHKCVALKKKNKKLIGNSIFWSTSNEAGETHICETTFSSISSLYTRLYAPCSIYA